MQTTHASQSLATLRAFGPADYADITRLYNANFAEFSVTAEEFAHEDSTRAAPCRMARWVAEWDGRIVAFAHYEQLPHIYHPRKFQLNICVDPDYYGRGIGRRLYDLLLAEVRQLDPLTIDEWARADMACRVGFLERRGFVEDMRMWTSRLDLRTFNPDLFAGEVGAVEAQGIQLRSWAELGADDPDVLRRTYEMWVTVREDVPLPPNDQRAPTTFEQWMERNNRPNLWAAGYFVALDGEQYVGTSQLWHAPQAGELRTGLTAVRREYRRRGIALALKVRSLELAKAHGYRTVDTENETKNQGMIGLNDRLGFVKNPAWVHYVKSFEG